MSEFTYLGNELDLFSAAVNWKAYWGGHVSEYLHGKVLEVGAGIGSNTLMLRNETQERWVCLEVDEMLAEQLQERLTQGGIGETTEVFVGLTSALPPDDVYDAIVYIDVLEHIEKDAEELGRAVNLLAPDGRLIVLSPSHNFLFSPFDKQLGHFRRYNKASLAAVAPEGVRQERLIYLDSAGYFASLGNRMLLRQSLPSAAQIAFWDRVLVSCSVRLDKLLGYRFGKSILAVWRKT